MEKIINEGGINGLGEGIVNINSEDFKILRENIKAQSALLSIDEKRSNILLSYRFQMESYVRDLNINFKSLGYFIKGLLKELGIKSKHLANYLDYEESNFSAFLNGRRKINADLALKLGRIFQLSPSLLLHIQTLNELKSYEKDNREKYLDYSIDDLLTAKKRIF